MTPAAGDVSFLVPAAGIDQRLGMGPKGFLALRGRPLLCWIADKALQVAGEVLVAVPADRVDAAAELLPGCRVIAGGGSRHDSVARLARAATGEWCLVHDAARPFASVALFRGVLAAARGSGCAGAFLDPEVPVARIGGGLVLEGFDRDQVGVFQAPQAFARALLLDLFAQAEAAGRRPQSTLQLALHAGVPVAAVPGEKHNIKLTTPEDWRHAALLEDHLR